MPTHTSHPYQRAAAVLTVLVLLLILAVLAVLGLTGAAFTDTTDNPENSWAAGSVVLTDDDADAARFTVTGMAPGDSDTRCIEVEYAGTLPADIRMYAAGAASPLADVLAVVVETGQGGGFGSCDGFVADATLYSGTLGQLLASRTSFGTAPDTWLTGGPDVRTHRFTVSLATSDNALQGATTGPVDFIWEAQSLTAAEWEAVLAAPEPEPEPLAPSAPTGVAATADGSALIVTFAAGAPGSDPVVSYEALCTPLSGPALSATSTTTPVTVTGASAGETYTCAVQASSSAGASPWSAPSSPVTLAPAITVSSVSVAPAAAYGWGLDTSGQLGNGPTTASQATPSATLGGHLFVNLASGAYHTCGIASTGLTYCWGSDATGQLGDSSTIASSSGPQAVALPPGTELVQVAGGTSHTCGITATGAAWCWGSDSAGQVGNGPAVTSNQPVPVAVDTSEVFIRIAAGSQHTCGLTPDGDVWCWGSGSSGQIGDSGNTSRSVPTLTVAGTTTFVEVTPGFQHTCAVDTAGAAWCWGSDASGQIGNGSLTTGSRLVPTPVAMPASTTFTQIDASSYHTCALTTLGSVWCWGEGSFGELGNGTTAAISYVPVQATAPGVVFTQVSTGTRHSCAIDDTTAVWCWGANSNYQLGRTGGSLSSPAQLPTGVPTAWLSLGAYHTSSIGVG